MVNESGDVIETHADLIGVNGDMIKIEQAPDDAHEVIVTSQDLLIETTEIENIIDMKGVRRTPWENKIMHHQHHHRRLSSLEHLDIIYI